MKYTLADGTSFDIEKIDDVSEIKDTGYDEKTITESTLSFTIRLRNGKNVKVSHNYHFNEWFEVFKELKTIRNDILKKREEVRNKKS
ncbi:MAG: hypothetical protein R6V77_07460 [Candidatus Cloacimonadaceae bacterium]